MLSGFLVQKFSPTAYGSGIPQVRAYLLGVKVPLDLRLALVKLISGSIALGSGLVMGREGPTVHVGAAIAAQIDKWFPTSKDQRKQLVAAGAGAGLAAAFNAPIAGVLFVAEELLKDISNTTIGTAIFACFVASTLTHIFNAPHMKSTHEIQSMELNFALHDVLFWILLGVLSGVLGALFNRGIIFFLSLYRDHIKIPVFLRVGLAGLVSGLVIALVPASDNFRSYYTLTDLIISGHTDWQTGILAFISFFFLTLLAYGSGAPGGLFAPSLVLGAALGSLVAFLEKGVFGVGSVETMAMVGMGAFFAAVARVPITAVVIISEITRHYNLVPPLMVATAIACFVGSKIEKGSIYDMLREYSGLEDEARKAEQEANQKAARDLMKPVTVRLDPESPKEDLLLALKALSSQGIPVFEQNKYIGLIAVDSIMNLANIVVPDEISVSELVNRDAVRVSPDTVSSELRRIFRETKENTLAVVDGDELKGLIHRADLESGSC